MGLLPISVRGFLADDLALRVEQQFSDRQCLDRYRRDVLFLRRRDLGRAGESGTDIRHLLVKRNHDLEGCCLSLSALLRVRLNGTVADLGSWIPRGRSCPAGRTAVL